jgi:diacylglycerol kinase family enzyme
MKVLLVGNPTAQSGKAASRIDAAKVAMRARGWAVTVRDTEPEGRTPDAVLAALGDHDVAVALGGDGTFREVALGLLKAEREVPLGLLPAGTANNQGTSLGISSAEGKLERNLEIIASGHVTRLDVGEVRHLDDDARVLDEAVFFDSFGMGLMPDILRLRNHERRTVEKIPLLRDVYRDQALYAGAALEKYLRSFTEPTKLYARVTADGTEHVFDDVLDVIISNTAVYGGEWVLDRTSQPDDGRFELVSVAGRRDWFIQTLRDMRKHNIWREHLPELGIQSPPPVSASSFEIVLERPKRPLVDTQLDGEEWVHGHRFQVRALPNLLPVLTPEGWTPPWAP